VLTKTERDAWVERGYKDPRKAYREHAASAGQRGIEFRLTFEQWWALWEQRYAERGTRKGQYCMCRTADKGGYEMGNVRIATVTENAHERTLEYLTVHGKKDHDYRRIMPPPTGAWLWRRDVFAEYEEEDE
jgi:hypothetical protein